MFHCILYTYNTYPNLIRPPTREIDGVGVWSKCRTHIVEKFFVDFGMNIKEIQYKLAKFAEERDWDQFHSPKNLVMALTSEVGELNELFQWLTEEQSQNVDKDEIRQEIADIFIYLLRLTDKLGIDIEDAVREKIEINAKKYPVDLAKGNATKYNKRNA